MVLEDRPNSEQRLNIISYILLANGIYDILCAFSILWLSKTIEPFIFLSKLHPNMFFEKEINENPTIKRLIAYWVLTYGVVRFVVGIIPINIYTITIATSTYLLEAICFWNEYINNKIVLEKALFVCMFSFSLGVILYFY